MQDRLIEIIVSVLLGLVALFILVAALDWVLPDAAPLGRWADIALAVVTILAIFIGGLFAAVKFDLFRDFEPHLTISHAINHRRVGQSYVHIDVTVTLHNGSKVKVVPQEGFLVLQRISPATDEFAEEVYGKAFVDGTVEPFEWPVLEELYIDWRTRDMVIEPGEAHSEVLEFIISGEVSAVQVYTHFYPPEPAGNYRGWSRATVYDIIQ